MVDMSGIDNNCLKHSMHFQLNKFELWMMPEFLHEKLLMASQVKSFIEICNTSVSIFSLSKLYYPLLKLIDFERRSIRLQFINR